MLEHAVCVKIQARFTIPTGRNVGNVMHPGGVKPRKEGPCSLVLALHEIKGRVEELLVHSFHAFLG